jgi:hypothetical protein
MKNPAGQGGDEDHSDATSKGRVGRGLGGQEVELEVIRAESLPILIGEGPHQRGAHLSLYGLLP